MTTLLFAIGMGLLGLLTWSIAEYMLHAWAFHKTKGVISREHRMHHAINGYFAPTWMKVVNAFVALGALGALFSLALGPALGVTYAFGIAAGYLGYEIFHRRLHTHPPRGAFGRWARRHHFHHHLVDARDNHGVTSPAWDHVFGTHRDPGVVGVHARMAPVWLWDVATDDVRPEFAADYAKKVPRTARPTKHAGRGLAPESVETAAAAR